MKPAAVALVLLAHLAAAFWLLLGAPGAPTSPAGRADRPVVPDTTPPNTVVATDAGDGGAALLLIYGDGLDLGAYRSALEVDQDLERVAKRFGRRTAADAAGEAVLPRPTEWLYVVARAGPCVADRRQPRDAARACAARAAGRIRRPLPRHAGLFYENAPLDYAALVLDEARIEVDVPDAGGSWDFLVPLSLGQIEAAILKHQQESGD